MRPEIIFAVEDDLTKSLVFFIVFILVILLVYSNTLAATESKGMTLKEEISQFPPLEGYPGLPLPPGDKTIVSPLPQTPMMSPSVPENRGAFNPRTGERYLPSGKGVYNPITGEYYPPSGNGYFNPQTFEYYQRVDHAPP